MISRFLDRLKNSDMGEIVRHGKHYLSAEVAIKATSVLSIPVFTNLMTREEYGIVSVFNACLAMGTVILALNTYSAVARYYYEKKGDFAEFLSTTMLLAAGVMTVTVGICLAFHDGLARMLEIPGPVLGWLLVACVFRVIFLIFYQIMIQQKRSLEYSIISMVRGYGIFLLGILLVWLLKDQKYLGRIWALLIVGGAVDIYAAGRILKQTKFAFRKEHVTYILVFCFPLIFHTVSSEILNRFDQIMINKMIGAGDAGLYSLGYNVGALMFMFTGATNQAYMPNAMRMIQNNEHDRLSALTRKVFSLQMVAALGLVLFAQELVMVLAAKSFHGGLCVVPLVVIGYVFDAMSALYVQFHIYEKRTYFTPIIVMFSGIVNIATNYLLIPKYGIIAAAYTTILSYFLMFILTWAAARFLLSTKTIPLHQVLTPALTAFAFMGVFALIWHYEPPFLLFFPLKVLLLAAGVALLFRHELKAFFARPSNQAG